MTREPAGAAGAREEQAAAARDAALGYLARRDRTSVELSRWMERKAFPEEVIAEVVARLQSLGYLDDDAFARRYAESRTARGYGIRRIARELAQKGIPNETYEAAVASVFVEGSESEILKRLADRRLELLRKEPDPRKRRKKLFDFLIRRGFSPEAVRRYVDKI